MKTRSTCWILTLAAALALVGTVSAQEKTGEPGADAAKSHLPAVEQQLDAMRQALQKQQEELDAMKTQLGLAAGDRAAIDAQREMIANLIKAETAKLTEGWGWISNWTLKGDFRYRHEWLNEGDQPSNRTDRNRQRIRLRLFLTGKVNDEMSVTTGLSTGAEDQVSTNQTLGETGAMGHVAAGSQDYFQRKHVMLDLAYLEYKPKAVPGLAVTAGRIPNPFYRVNKSDLIWDGDLNFEGVAATYKLKIGDLMEWYLNGGGFWLQERRYTAAPVYSTADTSLWGFQTAAKVDLKDLLEKSYALGGVSYYNYANIEGYPRSVGAGSGQNTVVGTAYAMDYNLINPFVEVGFPVFGLPVKVYGDLCLNTGAKSVATVRGSNDFAWLVGFQVNEAKNPGDWEVRYDYRDVPPDSMVSIFTDSDSWGGGTDGRGHRVTLGYALAKNVQVAATYFCDHVDTYNRTLDESFYHRLQVDFTVKF